MKTPLSMPRGPFRTAMLLIAGAAAAGLVAMQASTEAPHASQSTEASEDPSRHATATAQPLERPAGALRVEIDPTTGRLIQGRPQQDQARVGSSLAFSGAGLIERPLRSGIGGAYIDLRGRFLTSSVVTIEADGSIRKECAADSHQGHEHTGSAAAEDPS